MPWRETSLMDQKTQFIADVLRGTLSVVELCDSYGISRKTAYKWIDRYLKEGPGALLERSRRPENSPNSTPPELVQAIIDARRHHPSWGAKKLLKILRDKHPRWPWPQRTAVCEHRQWRAVRYSHLGSSVAALRVVGAPRRDA